MFVIIVAANHYTNNYGIWQLWRDSFNPVHVKSFKKFKWCKYVSSKARIDVTNCMLYLCNRPSLNMSVISLSPLYVTSVSAMTEFKSSSPFQKAPKILCVKSSTFVAMVVLPRSRRRSLNYVVCETGSSSRDILLALEFQR